VGKFQGWDSWLGDIHPGYHLWQIRDGGPAGEGRRTGQIQIRSKKGQLRRDVREKNTERWQRRRCCFLSYKKGSLGERYLKVLGFSESRVRSTPVQPREDAR